MWFVLWKIAFLKMCYNVVVFLPALLSWKYSEWFGKLLLPSDRIGAQLSCYANLSAVATSAICATSAKKTLVTLLRTHYYTILSTTLHIVDSTSSGITSLAYLMLTWVWKLECPSRIPSMFSIVSFIIPVDPIPKNSVVLTSYITLKCRFNSIEVQCL